MLHTPRPIFTIPSHAISWNWSSRYSPKQSPYTVLQYITFVPSHHRDSCSPSIPRCCSFNSSSESHRTPAIEAAQSTQQPLETVWHLVDPVVPKSLQNLAPSWLNSGRYRHRKLITAGHMLALDELNTFQSIVSDIGEGICVNWGRNFWTICIVHLIVVAAEKFWANEWNEVH